LVGSNSSGVPWADSDFEFAVLSNGFELSGPPAQSISSSSQFGVSDVAELTFQVTDLTDQILSLDVTGGNPSASGEDALAENFMTLNGNNGSLEAINAVGSSRGVVTSDIGFHFSNGAITFGDGIATPFALTLDNGGGIARIDSTTTDFTFVTGHAVPEPRSLTLVSIGVLGLLGIARCKLRRHQ